jgi:competence protein ComEC
MLWLAAMFAAGIAVFSFFQASISALMAFCVLFAVAAFVAAKTGYGTLLITAAFFVAGGVVYQAHLASITPDRLRSIYDGGQIALGEPVEITGTMTRDLEAAVEGVFVRVDVDSIRYRSDTQAASGSVRLFAPINTREMAEGYGRLDLGSGTRVWIACDLNRDDYFRNPGVVSRKTVLDWQDVDATGTIKSPLLVENVGSGGIRFTAFVFGFRDRLIAKFRELFSPQVAGVMIASLLGNKHFLDKQTADVFREGGTFHILVISGLHITFIGGLPR